MKTRTDEELNAIIHKWMKADEPPQPEILLLNTGNGRSYLKDERPPNYCGDLNAVHEAENQIFELQQAWENYVRHITDTCVEPADALHATARQRADALARVIEGVKCSQKHECQCGGIDHPHTISETGCFRYMTESPILAGKHPELGCDTWKMPDEDGAITDFTLRQQRGYHQHECGCWSRSEGSFNSVDA
jgi:hypothetical protein